VTVLILDGVSLARRREAMLAERAAAVLSRRGRAPGLLLVAFSDEQDGVPHIDRKLRMCAAAGVDATPLIIPSSVHTREATSRMQDLLKDRSFDGVFVQFPFPDTIDGDAFASAIPAELDVDIMTPVRTAQFMNGIATLPPVTVSAGLLLLDEYDVSLADRRGIVVARQSPFSLMFRAALSLRGADMAPLAPPDAPDLDERLRDAELVVVAGATPGLVQSTTLPPGVVAIDAGYFNPGGRGDIDVSGGIDHLAAISPVPGGIGPLTVSALIERVVLFAERS
jgi:methylenetetrahydrofolate dehydrogenase (NADP+)/methenyltetrahydrofolate cyclohydrolase